MNLNGDLSSAKNDVTKLREETNEFYEKLSDLAQKQWGLEESDIYFSDESDYSRYVEYCFPEDIDMEFKDIGYKPEKPKNVCDIFIRRVEWIKDENSPFTWLPFGKLRDGSLSKTKLGRLYLELLSDAHKLFPTPKWFKDNDPYVSPYWQSEEENKRDEEWAQKSENERVEMLKQKLYEARRNQNIILANKIEKELAFNDD